MRIFYEEKHELNHLMIVIMIIIIWFNTFFSTEKVILKNTEKGNSFNHSYPPNDDLLLTTVGSTNHERKHDYNSVRQTRWAFRPHNTYQWRSNQTHMKAKSNTKFE